MAETTQIETIKAVFDRDDIRQRFMKMLGDESESFMVSVINTVTNDRNLAVAERNSILFAAATAAALKLPINPNLGWAYIVAYFDKHSNSYKAQFQMGYKGFIQLAQRSSQFKTLDAEPVYEGDTDETVLARLTSLIKPPAGEKVIGYIARFQLINGFEKTLYMSVEDLKKHGMRYSQSFKKGYGLWKDDFDAMAQKTVLKLLLSKYAPLDTKMQKAVEVDSATIKNWEGEPEHIDNTPLDPAEVSREKEIARLKDWIVKSDSKEKLTEANQGVYESGDDELIALYEGKLKELGGEITA